jgi:hypothetical protein
MPKRQNELIDSVLKSGSDDVADAIGMPDAKDLETLSRIIKRFERTHPGWITYHLQAGRRDYELGVHRKKQVFDKLGRALISKDSNMAYVFELPGELHTAIEKVFPSMFRSKKHLAWFRRNFIKLTVAGK